MNRRAVVRWSASDDDHMTDVQSAVFNCRASHIVVHGGRGSGKSQIGGPWAVHHATARNPGGFIAVIGYELSQMRPTLIDRIIRGCLTASYWETASGARDYWRQGRDYRIHGGSKVTHISFPWAGSVMYFFDSTGERLRSHSAAAIYKDEIGMWEEQAHRDSEAMRRGKALFPQTLMTTTPEKSKRWFIQMVRAKCYGIGGRRNKNWQGFKASTRDAHFYPDYGDGQSYLEELIDTYTAEDARAYIDGELLDPSGGNVYTKWSESVHVWHDGHPLPEPRWHKGSTARICCDWGGTNFAPLLAIHVPCDAVDGGELRLVFDEVYMPGATVFDYGKEIGRRLVELQAFPPGRRCVVLSGDPQGGDANLGWETTRKDELIRGLTVWGIEVDDESLDTSPVVGNRVACVNRAFEARRVLVHPRCQRLIRDRRDVQWNKDGTKLDKGPDGSLTHYSDADDYDIFLRWGQRDVSPQRAAVSEPGHVWWFDREQPDTDIRGRWTP